MDQEDLDKMIELLIFAVIYGLMAVANLYRLIKGPTAADRMTSGDSMDILMSCAMMLFGLFSNRTIYLDIAIVTAMIGIIDTMLVGRYFDTGRWRSK